MGHALRTAGSCESVSPVFTCVLLGPTAPDNVKNRKLVRTRSPARLLTGTEERSRTVSDLRPPSKTKKLLDVQPAHWRDEAADRVVHGCGRRPTRHPDEWADPLRHRGKERSRS